MTATAKLMDMVRDAHTSGGTAVARPYPSGGAAASVMRGQPAPGMAVSSLVPPTAIPSIALREAERDDELLHRTGDAARRLLWSIRRYPTKYERERRLAGALMQLDEGLPSRVQQMAGELRRRGMSREMAAERAMAIGMADASIARIQDLGRRVRNGQPPPPFAGLGTTTPPPASGPSEGDIVAGMFQGIICSGALQNAITDTVGRNEGRDAANATGIGFGVGQGLAQCSSLTPPLPAVAPPTEPETSGSGLLVPVVVGVGVLAAVGGVLWWTTRKKAN